MYAIYTDQGRVVGYVSCPEDNAQRLAELNGAVGYLPSALPCHDTHYVSDGALVRLPACPSEFWDFDYVAKQWVPNDSAAWTTVRGRRDSLLSASDWVVTKAVELGQAPPNEWVAYRQALRDITTQPDPRAIVWPTAPV